MINIIQKGTASTVRATVDKLQYSGSFMEIPQLTVSVKSPTAIAFEIGDFITWGYDGLTYTLKELPQVHKQATSGSYGEAFVYDNMIFKSALGDVKYIDFLDVVPSSSTSHFSSLPTFSFYGNVFALIDRLNANLGRLYANWIVQAADVESGDIYDALYTERQVDISSPVKVWDALGLVYSMWGLGFVYYYDTGTSKHTIVIGATGGATGNFSYGQGNGLYMVGKAINKEDAIVTRLRAYGSTRNMPARYYNNKTILIDRLLIDDPLLYLPNLMIPYTKWQYTGGYPDPELAYINSNSADVDAADTSYAKYGIREKSIFFDGTNNLKEIYPTIEQITAGEMRAAIAGYSGSQYGLYYSPSVTEYPDATRLDKIKTGDTLTDDGVIKSDTIYTETATYTTQSANEVMTTEVITKRFDPIYYATLDNNGEYKITFTDQQLTVTGVNTDITDGTLRVWVQRNGSRVSLSKTIAATLITGGVEFTMPEIEISVPEGGDVYAIELDMDITIPTLGEGELATIHWVLDSGTATYTLTKVIPNTDFSISLKQIGFDIFRFLSNSGQNPVISMTSGACAGREFQIRRADYMSATDSWNLTCVRQCDTSLSNQWFPNKNFHIAADDTFVLLNINMPDILIDVAELRLYDEACKWLRKNKEQQYIYEPKVDEVYMAINPQVIKEGMMMPITDTDLGLSGSKLINTVTITENEGAVRTFEVVLRDDADQDLIKYLNSQAKQISSAAVGTITNATTSTTQSVDTLPVTQPSQQTELGYTPENVANKTGVLSENSTTAQYLNAKALYDRIALLPHYSFGAVEFPTITDNGNGSVTIGNGTYCLADNVEGTGFITCYTITGNTFSLTDLTQNYIVANYNSGTPVLQVITNVTLINETTIVPVFSIFRNGNVLHTQWWDMLGAALSNKIHQSIVKTQRYRRESGLSLSEYGTRNLNLTSGRIWIGAVPMDLDAVLTATDNLSLWYHSAGSWTNTIQASYNNTQYDNGNNLVELTNNRYAVNWIYRGVESQKHIYVVLGMGDYSLSDAQGAVVPALPSAISSHAVLVAKLIVQKNAATATSIQSAFDVQFSFSAPAAHNDLTGIQGGAINEYYHLSAAQLTIATQSATASRSGYLTSTDWSTFNGKAPATGGSGYVQNQIASAQTADYWISGKAKVGTLLLPQTAPSLAASEIGLYALESGFSGELPSGAGSVTSISMVVPTGLSVTPATITESGTFTISYASGYSIPTNTKQSEWNSAYNDKINSATFTASTLTLAQQDGGTIAVSVPTFNQNTTGSAATLTTPRAINVSVSGVSGTAQNFNGSAAITIPVTLTTLTRGNYLTGSNYNGGTATTWAVDATTTATANKVVARDANADIFVRDVNASRKVKGATLILPQSAPTLDSGEVGIYSLDSGFSGELPSGAGSVTSIALTMPTGFSVSGSPITESGTFGVTFASGYFLPTTTQFASKADVSLIGAANGIAPLDSGGKVALQYLPSTLLKYMGVWNASTNTPTLLATDVNRKGQVWNVSVAGTQFGIAFKLGDWLIYNDSGVAEKSDNSDDVVSVNGYTGAVTLKTSDIAEQTNLYYTDARVKAYADTLYTPLAHASATNNPHSVTAAQVGALALTGGYMTLDGIIRKKAYVGSGWSRDIVAFENSTATIRASMGAYGTSDSISYMYLGFNAYNGNNLRVYSDKVQFGNSVIYHSGNSNLTTIDWSAKNLTLAGSITGATTINASGNAFIGSGTATNPQSWGKLLQISNSSTNGAAISLQDASSEWSIASYSGKLSFSKGVSYNLFSLSDTGAALTSSIQATTAKLTNLTDGYIPYHISDASGLGNSPLTVTTSTLAFNGVINSPATFTIRGGKSVVTAVGEIHSAIDLGQNDGTISEFIAGRIASISEASDGASAGIAFYTAKGGRSPQLQEVMRLNNNLNVGIGYTSGTEIDNYKLAVNGALLFKGGISYGSLDMATYNITRIGTLSASGVVSLTNTTQSTAYTNGGLVLSGGLGIAKDLYSNGKGVFASSVQMLENINTNLRIPKVAPTSPTSGEHYFYIVE